MKQVIDTNVLLIANGIHQDISPECQIECISQLQKAQKNVTVIDDGFRILSEYKNKTHPNQPKGPGDVFLKWLLQNKSKVSKVETVTITETTKDFFVEFPDHDLQSAFDPPDRKFVAVASAHPDKPPILQAADCKWLNWWEQLAEHAVHVDFICPGDAQRFYSKKFPNQVIPPLPGKTNG